MGLDGLISHNTMRRWVVGEPAALFVSEHKGARIMNTDIVIIERVCVKV